MIKELWDWKINYIKKHPILSVYAAWTEGFLIGLLVYYFFWC
jgi:hypothetical protein